MPKAPRPAPLLHRAQWAQIQSGLFPLLDEARGSDHLEHDGLVVHRLAAFRGGAVGRRAGKCGQSAETLSQALSDFGLFVGLERLAAVVV
jgi:hypothetical protein